MDSRVTFNGKTRRPACLVGVPYGDNNYSESTLILSGERLIRLLLCSVSFQQLAGQTVTSWVPSSAGHYFESTAHLPGGADIRIQVVSIGNCEFRIVPVPPAIERA
jgi:hypothetical protein